MKHKTLVSVLKTFSPDELELFGRFINAPYHRKERILKSYYQTLKEFYPDFNSENFNDRYIYSRLHPEKEFDQKHADSLIRMLSSELTNLAEKFLLHINIIKDPLENKIKLVREESQRGLYKLASKNIDGAVSEFGNHSYDSNLFSSLEKLYKYKNEYEYKIKDFPEHVKSIGKESENFLYYIMSKASELIQSINLGVYSLNSEQNTNKLLKFFRSVNFDALLDDLNSAGGENNRLFKMYLYLLKMLCGKVDGNSFNEFQKLYKYNRTILSRNEKYNLYLMSISLCGKLKCSSDGNFMCACFDMHKNILKDNAYKPADSSYMSEHVYRAIVFASTLEKDIPWAESFVRNYTKELPLENRKAMYNLSLAYISFGKGYYEKAIINLSKISNELIQFKYDVKTLLLKIYYELNYTQEFKYVSDSFRKFLKNNSEVSDAKMTKYKNFINCADELMKYKQGRSLKTIEHLKKVYSGINEITQKAWLIEKIEELEKSS